MKSTMKNSNHPTPQPRGRTAEEILDDLTYEIITWKYGVVSAEAKAEQHKASRQLFNALLEIIGSPEAGDPDKINHHTERRFTDEQMQRYGRNQLRAEVIPRLRVFFAQPPITEQPGTVDVRGGDGKAAEGSGRNKVYGDSELVQEDRTSQYYDL